MAVVSVTEKREGRSSSQNALWQRTYQRTFIVQTDDARTGSGAVRTAAGIPAIGTAYSVGVSGTDPWFERDLGAFAQSVRSECASEDGKQWTVTVDYGPYDASSFSNDPTAWPIRVSFGEQKFEAAVSRDVTGAAIVNSAGDPFKDPVTRDDTRTIITVVRNEHVSAFSLTLAATYRDTVNNAAWNGFAAKSVKCNSITTSEPQYDSNNQVWYYAVTYVFEVASLAAVDWEGSGIYWEKYLLDQGFAVVDGSGNLQTVRDPQGQPVDEPVLLNGSGAQLAHGGTPVFLTYQVYPAVDFSALSLDLSTRLGH